MPEVTPRASDSLERDIIAGVAGIRNPTHKHVSISPVRLEAPQRVAASRPSSSSSRPTTTAPEDPQRAARPILEQAGASSDPMPLFSDSSAKPKPGLPGEALLVYGPK